MRSHRNPGPRNALRASERPRAWAAARLRPPPPPGSHAQDGPRSPLLEVLAFAITASAAGIYCLVPPLDEDRRAAAPSAALPVVVGQVDASLQPSADLAAPAGPPVNAGPPTRLARR
ncbi:hypothetical protein [Ramlibacter sp.]|uniref:hypothetical protein n=1 Tax=Ramlibacter sp. TaxID=1917967 RepID=UPI002C259F52|nr:hypothetical protein [Ramlibacter sp.]HWI82864.1 hypothetical protein [Ramlibacter sp.]